MKTEQYCKASSGEYYFSKPLNPGPPLFPKRCWGPRWRTCWQRPRWLEGSRLPFSGTWLLDAGFHPPEVFSHSTTAANPKLGSSTLNTEEELKKNRAAHFRSYRWKKAVWDLGQLSSAWWSNSPPFQALPGHRTAPPGRPAAFCVPHLLECLLLRGSTLFSLTMPDSFRLIGSCIGKLARPVDDFCGVSQLTLSQP